jgi:CxxC motif-containing protein
MIDLICITCPRGCHLKVDEENGYAVTGNACPRGEVYGYNEVTNPQRVITSTVRTDSKEEPRCPVKTNGTIPKGKMFEAMEMLDNITLYAPIARGQVVVKNLFDTGVDFITCKAIEK